MKMISSALFDNFLKNTVTQHCDNIDNIEMIVKNYSNHSEFFVGNVYTTVDNVKVLASIRIILTSLDRNALVVILLAGSGLLAYWAYRRLVQNKS